MNTCQVFHKVFSLGFVHFNACSYAKNGVKWYRKVHPKRCLEADSFSQKTTSQQWSGSIESKRQTMGCCLPFACSFLKTNGLETRQLADGQRLNWRAGGGCCAFFQIFWCCSGCRSSPLFVCSPRSETRFCHRWNQRWPAHVGSPSILAPSEPSAR
jgi:hypothetical protein